MNEFMDPSPLAKINSSWAAKYYNLFQDCPVDKSFSISSTDVKLSTLRPFVSRMNKELKKKFRVIKHDECYEIYRKE